MNKFSCIRLTGVPAIGLVMATAVLAVLFFWDGSPAAAQSPSDDYTYVLFEGGSWGRVGADGTVSGVIETPGDTDWFLAALEAGQAYRIDLEGTGTAGDALADPYIHGVYLYALELEGTRVDGGGEGLNSRLYLLAEDSTEYFIVAGSADAGTGGYTLSVTPVEHMVARQSGDDYGAHTATEGVLKVGGSVKGDIETEGDVDWFRTALPRNGVYRVDVEGGATLQGTLANPRLVGVYDARGELIEGTSDADSGEGLNSRLVLRTHYDGAYFVAVGSGETPWSEPTGTYQLSVTWLADDDYSQDTTTEGVIGVAVVDVASEAASGEIESPGDVDWFAVRLQGGGVYPIGVAGVSGGMGTLPNPLLLGVYDAAGDLVEDTQDDDGGTGLDSRLEFRPAAGGIYYVAVSSRGDTFETGTGTYRVSVLDALAGDDYGADGDAAGVVEAGATMAAALAGAASGNIGYGDDVDWFAVTLEANDEYRIHLDGVDAWSGDGETLTDPRLAGVYDADGIPLSSSGDDKLRIRPEQPLGVQSRSDRDILRRGSGSGSGRRFRHLPPDGCGRDHAGRLQRRREHHRGDQRGRGDRTADQWRH